MKCLVAVLLLLFCGCHAGREGTLVILGDSTAGHLQHSPHGAKALHTLQQKFKSVRFVEIPPGNKSLRMYAEHSTELDLDGDVLLVLAGGHDMLYNKDNKVTYTQNAEVLRMEYLRQRGTKPSRYVWFDTSQLNKWPRALRVDDWHLNDKGYARLCRVTKLTD